MDTTLMTSRDVDRMFRYSPGHAARLAKRGLLPHIVLPDGSLRFDGRQIERVLKAGTASLQSPGDSNMEEIVPYHKTRPWLYENRPDSDPEKMYFTKRGWDWKAKRWKGELSRDERYARPSDPQIRKDTK